MADSNEIYYFLPESLTSNQAVSIVETLDESEEFDLLNQDRVRTAAESGTLEFKFQYHSLFARGQDGGRAGTPNYPCLTLSVDAMSFKRSANEDEELQQNLESLISLIKEIYYLLAAVDLKPQYVIVASNAETAHIRQDDSHIARTTADGIQNGRLEQIYWGQILGPSMVEAVGEEKITAAPAKRVEQLEDGAVLFTHEQNPNYGEKTFDDIYDHFGIEQ